MTVSIRNGQAAEPHWYTRSRQALAFEGDQHVFVSLRVLFCASVISPAGGRADWWRCTARSFIRPAAKLIYKPFASQCVYQDAHTGQGVIEMLHTKRLRCRFVLLSRAFYPVMK